MARVETRLGHDLGDHPDSPPPLRRGRVHGDVHPDVEPAPPAFQFPVIQDVCRGPGPVNQLDAAVGRPVGQGLVNGRPYRGQTEPTGHNDQVAALGFGHRPGRAEGPPHPYGITRC